MRSFYTALALLVVALDNVTGIAGDLLGSIHAPLYTCSDDKLLKDAGIRTDQKSLIQFLATHSGADADLAHLDQLIGMLGDKQFKAREEAAKRILAIGPAALSKLHIAKRALDPELSVRASVCIDHILQVSNVELESAAVRLLAKTPDAGTLIALLRYLPYASEPDLADEIWFYLDHIALQKGVVHPELVSALRHSLPACRALAGCIVGHRGSPTERKLAARLLLDSDPTVRLRAAQGLLAAQDEASIPTLIDLLSEESMSIAWQAEELLRWAIRGDTPSELVGTGFSDSRQRCQTAWRRWWQRRGNILRTSKAAGQRLPVAPSLRLLVEDDQDKPTFGRIWLCGSDGQLRWQLAQLENPDYAHLLPSNRVLIHQSGHSNQLTEHDLTGKVLSTYELSDHFPLSIQCLPSGAIFVGSRTCISEIALGGLLTYRCDLFAEPLPAISSFRKLDNGHILCLSIDAGVLIEIDRSAKEICRHRLPLSPGMKVQGDILSDGHVLLTSRRSGDVLELDRGCNVVWKWKAVTPLIARLLPGHELLLASRLISMPRIIETDHVGNTVWEVLDGHEVVFLESCFPILRIGFTDQMSHRPLLDSACYRAMQVASNDTTLQAAALERLTQLGSDAGPAARALTELLKIPDTTMRLRARNILIQIGAPCLPVVIPLLRHQDPMTRSVAASILGACGKQSLTAAPHLASLLKDDVLSVRLAAASALVKLDKVTDDVVATLEDLLIAGPSEIRWNAVGTLARAGPRARGSIPLVIKVLKASDLQTQLAAAYAIGDLRDVTPSAIAALIEACQRGRPRKLRYAATHSLGQIGPGAKDALPSLLSILDEEPTSSDVELRDLRRVALEALTQIRPGDASLVPRLICALTTFKDPVVVAAALKGLADLGAIAAPAIPVIEEIKRAASPEIRRVADQTLQSINTSIARKRKSQ